MELIPKYKDTPSSPNSLPVGRDSSGIALFMVIAAVSVLAILVTEFTYIAQVSQAIAFGGLDQAKAHYLAKSGLKLSLLRLKAYQQVKMMAKNMGGGMGAAVVPNSLLEKIWSFPFFYPIPTNIPGMTSGEKEMIDKFQKESGLEGRFSALIESDTSKYNLNMLMSNYQPSGSPSPNPSAGPAGQFDPAVARASLGDYLFSIWQQKIEVDPDFASLYRDLRFEDLLDSITGWADRTYERRLSTSLDKVPPKKAPFYSVSELHMVPLIDDELYRLFAPNLTASNTPGININTMKEPVLRALVPDLTKDEVKDFFKYRDSEEADNRFKNPEDFYKYLMKFVAVYKNNQPAIDKLKNDLAKRNIILLIDESQFKITVQAQVNTAVRTIEAWVTLGPATPTPSTNPSAGPLPVPGAGGMPQMVTNPPPPDSGLKITFMRIL